MFSMPKQFGPKKCPVYLRVPWIGKAFISLDKNVKMGVENCYGSVITRMVFRSKRMLPVARKYVLPTTLKNLFIYKYSCQSNNRYVVRTSQRLQHRVVVMFVLLTYCYTGTNIHRYNDYNIDQRHQRQVTSTWWCSPRSCTGEA